MKNENYLSSDGLFAILTSDSDEKVEVQLDEFFDDESKENDIIENDDEVESLSLLSVQTKKQM